MSFTSGVLASRLHIHPDMTNTNKTVCGCCKRTACDSLACKTWMGFSPEERAELTKAARKARAIRRHNYIKCVGYEVTK